MTEQEAKKLNPKACYAFTVHNFKRKVLGIPDGLTIVSGWNFYAGDTALRIKPVYKRYGAWFRSQFYKIIPICAIKEVKFIEDGF